MFVYGYDYESLWYVRESFDILEVCLFASWQELDKEINTTRMSVRQLWSDSQQPISLA